VRRGIAPLLGWDSAEGDAAWERAEALLRDSVTSEQYASYQSRGYLEVPSRRQPGRVYRVDGWRPVAVFEGGHFVGAICIRPREHLPGPDVVLARKLLVEGAEDELLRSGNWLSPAWRPASAAPTILLLLGMLSPWLARFGTGGVVAAVALLVVPGLTAWWRRRRRRREQLPAVEPPAPAP
jgi:hypothetical protein